VNFFGRALSLARRAAGGLSPVVDNRGGWWPIIREPFTGAWQRNQEWTTDTVLAHHAVYACITRIAQDIGKLRPKLVERDANGIWTETENAAHSPALRKPNRFQNHIQFKESWAISKLTRGNTYVLIERDLRGVPTAFYVLDPSRVRVLVAPDGAVFYELSADNLSGLQQDKMAVPASEIIHDRMNCLYHPLVGTSPIFACGQAANLGLQIESNSSSFFGNGSNPSGILSTATPITPGTASELSDAWNARFGPGAPGGVAVLGLGVELDLDGLLRMDADSQVETLSKAVGGSVLTVNEARKKLDQKPVDGGDSIWMQQQNYSLDALAERDRNDPFAPTPAPALPAPEPQKALPAGDSEDATAQRMARLAALIDINAATLEMAA
jgi:phage portal protein BeeE